MVTGLLAVVVLAVPLLVFVAVGIRASQRDAGVDDYVVARNSQPPLTLGLSFLAAGMGAWILFAPPVVGALVGMVAVAGYAIGAAAPFAVFGLLGARIRSVLPAGHSLPEFLRVRFGRAFSSYVAVISVLYMVFFVTAELTAIGAVASILSTIPAQAAVVAVAGSTLLYTTIGGVRASIRTDRFQGWLILALLAGAAVAIVAAGRGGSAGGAAGTLPARLPAAPLPEALASALTLVIAVTAANMFHQGYWQRVWAARDTPALHRGLVIGSLTTVPVVLLLGFLGAHAAARGLDLGTPPAPFFAQLGGASTWLLVPVLVLSLALVASSVDTLETALASIFIAQRRGMAMATARVLTVALMIPATGVALQGFDVLRLFLIADLLCTATVVPALSSLWRRATTAAAAAGAIAGLAGAALGGIIARGGLDGLVLLTMPEGETLGPFLGALLGSSVVTVGVSLLSSSTADLESVGARVAALEPASTA